MSKALKLENEYSYLTITNPKEMGLCYGPIQQFGFTTSLGINLLGQGNKICSFDCPYCDLGRTVMRLNRIKKDGPYSELEGLELQLDKEFAHFSERKIQIDAIHISGNGEPTLYPFLSEAIDILLKLRGKYFSQSKLLLLTNGAHLDQRKTLDAVNKLDAVVFKLDVGNDRLLKELNAPLVRSTVSHLISISQSIRNLSLQSFFVQGSLNNTLSTDVEDWIEVIGLIKPRRVFITTLKHTPASNGLIACDEDTLYTIASKLERKTGIKSEVV